MLSSQQKLAKRLIRLRVKGELSQREVANKAGFTQPLWKGVGRRDRPKLSEATRPALADFLGAGPSGEVSAPKHPQLHQVLRSSDPLWPMPCI